MDKNFENLKLVHNYWSKYGEEEGSFKAICDFIAYQNDIITDIKGGSFYFDVEVNNDLPCAECNFRVNVWSFSSDFIPMGLYTWNFGDGTSVEGGSTIQHKYDSPGSYVVTCKVPGYYGEIASSQRTVNITTCGTAAIQNVKTDQGIRFNVHTTHCGNQIPSSYLWKIWDNGEHLYTDATPTHHFSVDNSYGVEVNVTFPDGCIAKDEINLNVSGTGVSCVHKDKDSEYYYDIASGYRLHHFFTLRHFWPFHRIVVKSVHEKKQSNGKWKRDKAAYLWVSFEGIVYDYKKINGEVYTCASPHSLYPSGKSNTNSKTITYDYGVGYNYSVRNQGVKSKWKVKSTNNGQQYEKNPAIQLH